MLQQQSNGFWLSKNRPDCTPSRVISCVPSQTELLHYLGLEDELVGITLFCVHPKEWLQSKPRIGGTKTLKLDKIRELQPDLILANKEENIKEQLEELAKHFPVFITDVNDFESALQSIGEIGSLVVRKSEAEALRQKIEHSFAKFSFTNKPRVVYLIWNEPLMTIGGDTFISSMLSVAGFQNCFADYSRYPEITIQDILEKSPDYVFLSSEPFPFQNKHKEQFVTFLPIERIHISRWRVFFMVWKQNVACLKLLC